MCLSSSITHGYTCGHTSGSLSIASSDSQTDYTSFTHITHHVDIAYHTSNNDAAPSNWLPLCCSIVTLAKLMKLTGGAMMSLSGSRQA